MKKYSFNNTKKYNFLVEKGVIDPEVFKDLSEEEKEWYLNFLDVYYTGGGRNCEEWIKNNNYHFNRYENNNKRNADVWYKMNICEYISDSINEDSNEPNYGRKLEQMYDSPLVGKEFLKYRDRQKKGKK
jgi:hypothetical protein